MGPSVQYLRLLQLVKKVQIGVNTTVNNAVTNGLVYMNIGTDKTQIGAIRIVNINLLLDNCWCIVLTEKGLIHQNPFTHAFDWHIVHSFPTQRCFKLLSSYRTSTPWKPVLSSAVFSSKSKHFGQMIRFDENRQVPISESKVLVLFLQQVCIPRSLCSLEHGQPSGSSKTF